jgi:L-asparagine transporter-like permease
MLTTEQFVDKAFGVAVGWNYFIIWFAVLANEYNTISSIFVFWSDKVPVWGYFLIFWVCNIGRWHSRHSCLSMAVAVRISWVPAPRC